MSFIVFIFLLLLPWCSNTIVEVSFWHFPIFEGSNNELSVILKQSAYLNSKFTSEFYKRCYKDANLVVAYDMKSFSQIFNPLDFLFTDDWHFSDDLNDTRLRKSLTDNTEIYTEMVKTLTVMVTSKKLISNYFGVWSFPSNKVDFNITSCKMIANGASQFIQQYTDRRGKTYYAQHLHQYVIQGFINFNDRPYSSKSNSGSLKTSSKRKKYSPLITVLGIN